MDVSTLAVALGYTKKQIEQAKREGFKVQVEQDRSILETTGEEKTLYLLPKASGSTGDGYDEFVYAQNNWEWIGKTDVDFDDYALKTDVGDLDNLPTTDKSSLVAAVSETFTNVSSGKALIASAITDKGVQTASDATFATMAQAIDALPTGGTLIPKTITENGVYNASSDNADGYDVVTVGVPQDPYEVMNNYIEGTLTRLRLNNVPSGRLKYIFPGSSATTNADQTIQRVELPNNTDAIGVWQFGSMNNLLLFDSGYTPAFNNVCLARCANLKWIVIRKNDGYATLFSTGAIAPSKIAVIPSLIEGYKNETNWSSKADDFRNLYFANSDIEKETLIADSSIPNDSMIVCDYNETYYVKGEGVV